MLDAVVTAGGRLSPAAAQTYGTDVKALVRVGGRTLLDRVVGALRGVPSIGRIAVVGPQSARAQTHSVDEWVDEFATGEENLLAALRVGTTDRIVLSASDLPFVTSRSYEELIGRAEDADAAYPIFTRAEFLAAYPGGRSSFAKLADGEWTGGSAFVVNRNRFLSRSALLERGFGARKSLTGLAMLLGPLLLFKYVTGTLRIRDVEARASSLLAARVKAVTRLDPALAMDCDDARDFDYALGIEKE